MILLDLPKELLAIILFGATGGFALQQRYAQHRLAKIVAGSIAFVSFVLTIVGVVQLAQEYLHVPAKAMTQVREPEKLTAPQYYLRGNERLHQNDAEGALGDFDSALLIRPDFGEALNSRGKALTVLGRYDEAIDAFNRAKAILPSLAETEQEKAIAYDGMADKALQPLWDAVDDAG